MADSRATLINTLQHRSGIYTPEEFGRLREREQLYTDRSGASHTVVEFSVGNSESRRSTRKTVGRLREFIRFTDHLGWIDEHTIGVILTMTDPDQARKFAAKVQGRIGESASLRSISSYPDLRRDDYELTFSNHQPVPEIRKHESSVAASGL
jgi:hypothetical protein